jgi:hypothetical protein
MLAAATLENIHVSGITLKDSPFWTFSARGLLNAVIHGVTVCCNLYCAASVDVAGATGDHHRLWL